MDGIRIFSDIVGTQGGARLGLSPLQDIAAEDIERIEVIKGASAATLYGTEAAAGVIQIFTKRGVSGAPIWSAEITGGLQQPAAPQHGQRSLGAVHQVRRGDVRDQHDQRATYGQDVKFGDPTCPSSGRWFKNGRLQRYSLSVRGGAGDLDVLRLGQLQRRGRDAPDAAGPHSAACGRTSTSRPTRT